MKLSNRLTLVPCTPSRPVFATLSPKLKEIDSKPNITQMSTPNFLCLTSYNYESMLDDNFLIEKMRETKLLMTKNKQDVKLNKKISGQKLVSQISVVDLNLVKCNRPPTRNHQQIINPTQITVKAKLKGKDKHIQTLTAGLERMKSMDNMLTNVDKLSSFKTTNIPKLMGSHGKKKLPNLKTTTISKDVEKIPYNRYVKQKGRLAISEEFISLGNKENLPTNTESEEVVSENQKSAFELPQIAISKFARGKEVTNKSLLLYRDKNEISKMIKQHETVKFETMKRKISMLKSSKPNVTDVDQWNIEYLQQLKN